jgi:hypothetical protein
MANFIGGAPARRKHLARKGERLGGLAKGTEGRMSATLLSEDGEARLTRLAWRDLQRDIAKYPQLELTRAREIVKYLRELAVGPRGGRDNVRDAIVQLFRFVDRLSWRGSDLREAQPNQQH